MSLTATLALMFMLGSDRPASSEVVPARCAELNAQGCTLKNWMQLSAQAHLDAGDFGKLAVAMRRLSNGAPPSEIPWRAIARQAAIEAESKNIEGVRTQCKACHDRYSPSSEASRPHGL